MQHFEHMRDQFRDYVELTINTTLTTNPFQLRAELWRKWIMHHCLCISD